MLTGLAKAEGHVLCRGILDAQSVEDHAVEQLIAKAGVEALDVAVLPGAAPLGPTWANPATPARVRRLSDAPGTD